jgi:chorismate mutase/prephenate dehydratase
MADSAHPDGSDRDTADTLQALRGDIDALDRHILQLLNQRAAFAMRVGQIKRKEGSPIFRPEREVEVIAGLQAANAGPLPAQCLAPIWREIMSACRALEAPTRVAYLGPPGTFSEEAALGYFGSAIEGQPCASIDEVFRATTAGAADFGLVPIENSTEGMVGRSLDLFLTTPLHIVGETSLAVRHNLLRATPGLDGLSAVCAHPQALAQCQAWLNQHLPTVERRAVASNAQAAQMAAADASLAAIASTRAANLYGLHVACAAIQDDPSNRTRFAVVTDPQTHPMPGATGHDGTSLVVSLANRPGAVYDMLSPLKKLGVSMTRFESRPARSGQWEYYFYIDLAGHPRDPRLEQALQELQSQCAFFKLLGAYPRDPR